MSKTSTILAELWDFFKTNFKWLIVAGAFLLFYTKGCFQPPIVQQPHTDTVIIVHDRQSGTYTPPPITINLPKPTTSNKPEYIPDTSSIHALRLQFENLVRKHTEQVTYNDSLKIDSLGYVNVKDTVSENRLHSRSYSYNIKERIITKTLPTKLRNQVFIGGGLGIPLSVGNIIQSVKAGVLFKNKRDNVLGADVLYYFPTSKPGVQFSYYLKIKL